MSVRAVRSLSLEVGAHNRIPLLVAVAAFLVAVGLLAYAVVAPSTTDSSARDTSFATKKVVNAKGGYRLAAPARWTAERAGKFTTLSSSSREVSVTVGPAPKGSLAAAGKQLFDGIAATYRRVSFSGATKQVVGGREAVVFSGRGTNEAGVRLRFVGVTFSDGGRNHSMTAFARKDSSPGRVLPRIERILNSFTIAKR